MLRNSYYDSDEILKEMPFPCKFCGARKHKYYILDKIHRRIAENKNTNILTIGDNRSGKSETDLKYAFDSDVLRGFFSNTDNVLWSWESLMNAYIKWSRRPFILEEIGTVYNRMNWMTDTNRYFTYLMQTQAYLCNTLFMNVPDMDFIPKNLWSLLNFIVWTERYDDKVYAGIYRVRALRLKGKLRFEYKGNHIIEQTCPQDVIIGYREDKANWNKANLMDWKKAWSEKHATSKKSEDSSHLAEGFSEGKKKISIPLEVDYSF